MSNIRGGIFLFQAKILCCITVSLIITPISPVSQVVGQQLTTEDPFYKAVAKREARAQVVDITFRMKEFQPRGSPALVTPEALLKKGASQLDRDHQLESTNRIVIQKTMMRCEVNHSGWHVGKGMMQPSQVISVSNEKSSKTFYPKGVATDTDGQSTGTILRDLSNLYGRMYYMFPVTLTYRGLSRTLCVYPVNDFRPRGAQLVSGKNCLEYEYSISKTDFLLCYVDPGLDYQVVRIRRMKSGKISHQQDVQYKQTPEGEWTPTNWVEHNYTPTGQLQRRTEVEILSLVLNEPLAVDQFDVVYPPGTLVHDQHDQKDYRVQIDGRMREVSASGEELSRVVRQNQETLYQQYKWWIWGFLVLFLVVLGYFGRRWLSRK